MTFLERYSKEDTWYGKVMIMEIYHLAMSQRHNDWTITNTAADFDVSVSLVSENLKIAKAMHIREDIINCKSRVDALKKLNGGYQ